MSGHAVLLRCQVQIEAPRRPYAPGEEGGLRDLFGDRERWGKTMKGLLWTQASLLVPGFTGSVVAPLELPCSSDLLQREVLGRLVRYKSQRGLPTWEEAILSLLPAETPA